MYLLVALLLFVSSVSPMEITKKEGLFVPNKLGNVQLFKTEEGFEVVKDSESIRLNKFDIDPVLMNLNEKNIKNFGKYGSMHLTQFDNGDYSLKAKAKIKGGGPLAGMIAAWTVRAIMYGVATTTATTTVIGSAVISGPAGPTILGSQIVAAAPGYITTTEGLSAAAGILGYACIWLP